MILVYKIGNGPEHTYALDGSTVTIGRGRSCDLRVDLDGIEDKHCRLERRASGWYVVAGHVRVGTFVVAPGSPVAMVIEAGRPLGANDKLLIGHETQPRFLAWLRPEPDVARDSREPRGVAAPPPAPCPPATEPRSHESAALREQLTAVRRELAQALQAQDASSAERERALAESRTIEDRLNRAHREEHGKLDVVAAARLSRINDLTQQLVVAQEEERLAHERLRHERSERESALDQLASAMADVNAASLLAQKRMVVIEELSGQVAVLEETIAERNALIKNLETENARLRGERRD